MKPDINTVYGPWSMVCRLNKMTLKTPQMAQRIARNSGRETTIKLSGYAGWRVAALYRDWGSSLLLADDDPRIGFWEALESQLSIAAKKA